MTGDRIVGVSVYEGKLDYDKTTNNPRACIVVRNNNEVLVLSSCSRDTTIVSTDLHLGSRRLILTSAKFPHDSLKNPPPNNFRKVVKHCVREDVELLVVNDMNNRGESLFSYILSSNLYILNKGNTPTFVINARSEVLNFTLGINGTILF